MVYGCTEKRSNVNKSMAKLCEEYPLPYSVLPGSKSQHNAMNDKSSDDIDKLANRIPFVQFNTKHYQGKEGSRRASTTINDFLLYSACKQAVHILYDITQDNPSIERHEFYKM